MKQNLKKAKEDFKSLYKKDDLFKIIKINKEPEMMPIEALHLKSQQIFGFVEDELK